MSEEDEDERIQELKDRVYNLEKEVTVLKDQIKELEKKKAELDERDENIGES